MAFITRVARLGTPIQVLGGTDLGPRGVPIQVLGGVDSGLKGAHSPQNVPVLATEGVRC
jgi:hypothetical protein